MKKVVVFLTMIFCVIFIYADTDGLVLQNSIESIAHQGSEENQLCMSQECELSLEEDELLDYEQHVCDAVIPPKVSSMQAFFTQIGCSLLINYIVLKERVKIYFLDIKNMLKEWFAFNKEPIAEKDK